MPREEVSDADVFLGCAVLTRILAFDPQSCDGCGECVSACAAAHQSSSTADSGRIRIIGLPDLGVWVPLLCLHCEQPSCVLTCPTGALARHLEAAMVELDSARCVGCGMCIVSCPIGAIKMNPDTGKASKCDLCQGNPSCVRSCRPRALTYFECRQLGRGRRARAAVAIGRVIGSGR
ncbi:MAG: 4Fe-4S dicluster domain-containing protein [Chloroflexi bacterium]|nr:4Fe-4S dicluster domain-containing protein [Chloroflexota bacterium]